MYRIFIKQKDGQLNEEITEIFLCAETALCHLGTCRRRCALCAGSDICIFYFVDHTHPDEAYLICGAVMFLAGLFIQIGFSVNRGINGTPADYLSDYDKDVIGTAFMYGEKKRMFYSALELLLAEIIITMPWIFSGTLKAKA